MIDTDKYKGHTEGPWYRMHSNDTIRSEPMGDNAEAYLFDIVGATTVDAELAADAPLLLAEVKRLREGIKEQMQFALDCVGSDIGDLYETIADDLRRLIE